MSIEFGGKIKGLRERRGWNQKIVATKLGVSINSVSQWERGRAYPRGEILAGIAELFGLTVEQLLGRDSGREMPATSAPIDASSVPSVAHLLEFIHADAALDPFTGLPGGSGARQRFREALAEAERKLGVYAEDLMRALEHRKNELLAEARRPKSQR